MNEALTWILAIVQSVDPVLRTLLAGVGILLETSILIGLIVPGDTVVLVASTAVGGPVEYVALVVAVVVGALCGESIGFGLGRWFGPRIRASRLGRKLGPRNFDRAEAYLARHGSRRLSGGYVAFQASELRALPVPILTSSEYERLAALADARLAASSTSEADRLDRAIDELVASVLGDPPG